MGFHIEGSYKPLSSSLRYVRAMASKTHQSIFTDYTLSVETYN